MSSNQPTSPDELDPFDALLYHQATHPQRRRHSLSTWRDKESVYFTATHGPRNTAEAEHIHATPPLLQLLSELWNDQPPTPQTITRCLATPEGTTLLEATGHHPTNTTPDTDDITVPADVTPPVFTEADITPQAVDDLVTAFTIYFGTLKHDTEPVPAPRAPDRMVFRGGPTPPATPPETRDVWTTTTTLPNGHTITLKLHHHPNYQTGQPTLWIQTGDAWDLLDTHLTWTLTYTHTNTDGTTCTHTTTTTAQDHHATTLTWNIPTPHHPTPTNNPTLTLTPTTHPDTDTDTE